MILSIYLFSVNISKLFFRCVFPVFKILNIYVPKSTMGVVDALKSPSSASMTCLENFEFNLNYVKIFRPKIISYLPLADSSTWHFHAMPFSMLSVGKAKSTLTLRLVVILPACMCHCIRASFSGANFY